MPRPTVTTPKNAPDTQRPYDAEQVMPTVVAMVNEHATYLDHFPTGTGSPEGVVVGSAGDIYIDTTAGAGAAYLKVTGTATNTGWKAITHA